MVDFRTPSERHRDENEHQNTLDDYRRINKGLREENAQLHAQLGDVQASHLSLQEQMNQLIESNNQFRDNVNQQLAEVKRVAGSMETMISSSFSENKALMESMRTGIVARLDEAKKLAD